MPKQLAGKETPITSAVLARVSRGAQAFIEIIGGQSQWLGPGEPVKPVAPPGVEIREHDYPTGYDYSIQPRSYEAVDFAQLQSLADGYDLLRGAIETRKNQIQRLPWAFRVKKGGDISAHVAKAKTLKDPRIPLLTKFFHHPDREHTFRKWVGGILENMLVLDAVCIHPRFARNGDVFSLDLIEASTITRKINAQGRTPEPPQVAYQQIIHGLPSKDLITPNAKMKKIDQLVYYIRNYRPGHVYGYSPVEQLILTVNIALRRQISQLEFYTEGGRPDAFIALPKDWVTNPDNLSKFQMYWDSLFVSTAARRSVRFVPEGSKMTESHKEMLKDEYDEWLGRIICWLFGLPPNALIRMLNRSSGEQHQNTSEEEGLQPYVHDMQDLINGLVQTYWGFEDIEFAYGENSDADPLVSAQVQDIKIKNLTLMIDEARDDDGRAPRGMDDVAVTSSGPVALEAALSKSAEPTPAPGSSKKPKGEEQTPLGKALKKKTEYLLAQQALTPGERNTLATY